jgi:hypothetical protein
LSDVPGATIDRDGGWWFSWPLAGWGIGLAVHTLVVVFGVFSPGGKMRKAEEIYRRSHGTPPGR